MGLTEKNLLMEWSKWLLKQGTNDAASDNTGAVLRDQNHGRDIWFIPGSWGQTGKKTRPLLDVPKNSRLFIVVASSHATHPELPAGVAANDAELKKHAEHIHRLWRNTPQLLIGGVNDSLDALTEAALVKETTDAFDVNINADNMYTLVSKGTANGNGISGSQRMVTVGHVHLTAPVTKPLQIVILGQSLEDPKTGKNGEKEYNVHVRYAMQ